MPAPFALGGATVSLVGTAQHSHDWDDRWFVRHLIRLVAGAVAATVAFPVLQTVLPTAGATSENTTTDTDTDHGAEPGTVPPIGPSTPAETGFHGGTAFVVGFIDEVFLDLVAEVTKVLLASGGPSEVQPFSSSLSEESLDFGDVPCGQSSSKLVVVTLAGTGTSAPRQG
ncbi:hypothetical protein [Kineococcus aurantiacus]|uniref:Uncharacterized protein n=1 Tax=Kineococcus aurantiacus TaxID=37633 RepID=A0A7Y9DGN5_9ACTN|nr:hypothetical protein [Kineococcus aurantiacus]NYD20501.1 hypothetical protein [Kineococcus aurantiacus]